MYHGFTDNINFKFQHNNKLSDMLQTIHLEKEQAQVKINKTNTWNTNRSGATGSLKTKKRR